MAYFQKVPAKNKKGYRWKCTKDAPRHPLTGKRRQVTRRGETKDEAEAKVDQAIEKMLKEDRGDINQDLENITVKELFDKWLDLIMKRKLKESTLREYKNTSKKRIISVLGDYRVKNLNSVVLQEYINDLSDEGLSPRYIEYISTILHGALESARKWKVISNNPLHDVEKPRPRRVKHKVWSLEEVNSFLEVAKVVNPRIYAIVSFALKTGLRRGEILALKWDDIDFDNKIIIVSKSLMLGDGGYRIDTPKTESSLRTVSFGNSLYKDLKWWKAKQNRLKLATRNRYNEKNFVFTNTVGNHIDPSVLGHEFNKVIESAGVTKIRFHDLRHTHATLCLEAGMSLKELQDRLGHSSIKTTGDVYAHVTDKMRKNTSDLFDDYIEKTQF